VGGNGLAQQFTIRKDAYENSPFGRNDAVKQKQTERTEAGDKPGVVFRKGVLRSLFSDAVAQWAMEDFVFTCLRFLCFLLWIIESLPLADPRIHPD
jgi:hypothetical protein